MLFAPSLAQDLDHQHGTHPRDWGVTKSPPQNDNYFPVRFCAAEIFGCKGNFGLRQQTPRTIFTAPCVWASPTAPLIYSGKGGGFLAQTMVNLFQALYKAAGIAGASSHNGRRQFVTELADRGVNARVVQALARHRHLNTTMRYIDLNENRLRKAIELV